MQFRRSGQRDERRRRVLNETLLDNVVAAGMRTAWGSVSTDGVLRTVRRSENYGNATFMDEQLRLTDLIPRRLITLFVLFTLGLAMAAGLEGLYVWMLGLPGVGQDAPIAALNLGGEGSLADWFGSITLFTAAVIAVVIYTVRRHKTDDYHGHYRVWLWAAACWLLMSVDEGASLHEAFGRMMVTVTGTTLWGDGSIWWVIAYFFLLGAVGTRILIDVRRCRLCVVALMAAATCYLGAVAALLGWLRIDDPARTIMLEEGAEMVGNLSLLLAMGLYARFVVLDAEGLLFRRKPGYDEESAGEPGDFEIDRERKKSRSAKTAVTVHPPHGVPRPASHRSPTVASVEQAETSVGRKLTKGEKKALSKRLRKMARERTLRQAR